MMLAAIQTTLNNRKERLLTALRLDEVDLPDTQRAQLVLHWYWSLPAPLL